MSFQTSIIFAVAKKDRVPLAEIDPRGTVATEKLSRLLPTTDDRAARASSFNSAL
ncbi:FXSXX-COOH protein [Streptomyces sp. NPDC001941]|uniref:FXSXX-COOH protein n=1 Tax=Streptomyces sp. NPDC001941 TaxID=3154659 RepID=UPI00333231A8